MVVKQAGTDISSTKGIKIRYKIKPYKGKKGVIKNSIHKNVRSWKCPCEVTIINPRPRVGGRGVIVVGLCVCVCVCVCLYGGSK